MTPFVLFAGLAVGGLRSPWPWTAFAAFSWGMLQSQPPRRGFPAPWLWGAALGWTLLSAALSPEPVLSLAASAYPSTAFAWLVLGATRSDRSERIWAVRLLWLSAAVFAGYALAARVPGYFAVGLLYPYYNYTAAVVASAGAAAAAAWAASKAPMGLVGFAGSASYLYWCGSRGGLVGLAAASAFSLWRGGHRRLLAVGMTVAAAALVVPTTARDSLLKLERPGSHARPQIWRAALGVAAERPFLGEGPGRFERGFLRHQVPTPPAMNLPRYGLVASRAHSEPIGVLAETGLVGLSLLLASLWSLWRRRPSVEPSREPLLAAAVALGVQACGDSIFALPSLGWLFAWTMGAGCSSQDDDAGRAEHRLAGPARRGFAAAGMLLASCAWLPGWFVADRMVRDPRAAALLAPKDSDVWGEMARADYRKKDLIAAVEKLGVVAELRPFDARPRVMAAELLLAHGRLDAVRALAADALSLEPDCGQAHLLLAQAALTAGDRDEARRQVAELKASRAKPLDGRPETFLVGYDAALLSRLEGELNR